MSIVDLQTCTLKTEWVSHAHDFHQLIFATSGLTELSIEGRGNRITEKTGCLIPAGFHHDYLGDGNNNTLVMNLPTHRLPMLAHSDDVQRLFDRPTFYQVPAPLRQLGGALACQAGQQPGLHDEIAVLILRAIYLGLFEQPLTAQSQSGLRHNGRLSDHTLLQIDDYVDQNLAVEIQVGDLARLCYLSPGYFYQAFRDCVGTTPMAYVNNRRMAKAQQWLRTSPLPLSDIAGRIGFRDQGSFSRAYRRHFGQPPSSLRV